MSSTYSSGKRVSAIRATNGTILYALHEETCCSNVYPRTPRWSVTAIGTIETVMAFIFHSASYTTGGCLKGANGRSITPHGYVQGWLAELANPHALNDTQAEVHVHDGYSAILSVERFAEIKPRLLAFGLHHIAESLERGDTVSVSLANDPELVDCLWGKGGGYRLIRNTPAAYDEKAPDLAYNPAPSKVVNLPVMNLATFKTEHAFSGDNFIYEQDGVWHHAGDFYRAERTFWQEAYKAELANPGTYRKRYKAFTEMLNAATKLSTDSVRVHVDPKNLAYKWHTDELKKAAATIKHEKDGDNFVFEIPTTNNEIWCLQRFFENATFTLGKSTNKPAIAVQMDLLAG